MTQDKYYVYTVEYVGPNPYNDGIWDSDDIIISTSSATYNMTGEPCLNGWCGTTNDWCVMAYGEFASLEEAERFVHEKWNGDFRDVTDETPPYERDDRVKIFRMGKYETLTPEATEMLYYEAVRESISSTTSDEEIEELVDQWIKESQESEGVRPDRKTLLSMAPEFREFPEGH